MKNVLIAVALIVGAGLVIWLVTRTSNKGSTPPPAVAQPPAAMAPAPMPPAQTGPVTFRGTWVTTNRKLDGEMTCIATQNGNNWSGRFFGAWHGRSFSYNVTWSGPPDKLQGTAVIDGAFYQWTGSMEGDFFKGTFTGSRYNGYFNLKKQ
jgi:hypothetical protein